MAYKNLGQFTGNRGLRRGHSARIPNIADAYCNRGVAYKNLGQFQRAIEVYDKAILLVPQLESDYANRAAVRLLLGNDQGGQQNVD